MYAATTDLFRSSKCNSSISCCFVPQSPTSAKSTDLQLHRSPHSTCIVCSVGLPVTDSGSLSYEGCWGACVKTEWQVHRPRWVKSLLNNTYCKVAVCEVYEWLHWCVTVDGVRCSCLAIECWSERRWKKDIYLWSQQHNCSLKERNTDMNVSSSQSRNGAAGF